MCVGGGGAWVLRRVLFFFISSTVEIMVSNLLRMLNFRRNVHQNFVIYHGCYGIGRHLEFLSINLPIFKIYLVSH